MFRASGTGMSTHAPIYDLGRTASCADRDLLSPILAVFGVMALVIWGATEWVAWRFRFHPNLGAPVFEASSTGRVLILSVAGVLALLLVASVRVEPLRRVVGTLAAFLVMAIATAFLPACAPWAVWVWDWNFGHAPRAKAIFEVSENAILVPPGRPGTRMSPRMSPHAPIVDALRGQDRLHAQPRILVLKRNGRIRVRG